MAVTEQPAPGPGRIERAFQPMDVEELAGSVYRVRTLGGHDYRVDVEAGVCLCDDFQHRGETIGACKHIIRARMVHEGKEVQER